MGFPGGLGGKESVCNVGDLGWEDPLEHGNPLQYSCLENPHGQRSLVDYSPWGCKESGTTEHLSTAQHIQFCMRVWSVQPHGLYSTRLLCPWVSPGRNTGVGCHFLLQGIFLTQGLYTQKMMVISNTDSAFAMCHIVFSALCLYYIL